MTTEGKKEKQWRSLLSTTPIHRKFRKHASHILIWGNSHCSNLTNEVKRSTASRKIGLQRGPNAEGLEYIDANL